MEDWVKPEFWKQPWVAFQNEFWVILPLFVIVVLAVWWLRGKLYEAQIAGLKEQMSGLKEQMVAIEQRFKLAAEGLDCAKNDTIPEL
jgi:hypothetical protein